MAVTLEFKSSAAKVIRDQEKILKQVEEMGREYKETAKEAGQLERAAQRLNKQLETPQDRHNKKLKELGELLRSGRINQDQMRRAVEMYNRQLREAETGGMRAFGGAAIGRLASYAAGLASVSRAASAVVEALNRVDQARAAGSERLLGEAGTTGRLVALAGGDARAAAANLAARETLFAEGGFATRDQAGALAFELASANLLGERGFASKLAAVDDAAGIAKSAGGLREAFGVAEAGNLRQIFSKGIAAAGPVVGAEASDILAAAAMAGASGGQQGLGLTDEEIIAAVAQISKVTSSDEAGTRVNALLRSFTKMGFADRPGPRSLSAMMQSVEGRELLKSELQTELGDVRAGQAFALLTGPGYAEMLDLVRRGQADDLAGTVVGQAMAQPDVALARGLRGARAREMQATERMDLQRMMVDTALANERNFWRSQRSGFGMEVALSLQQGAVDLVRKFIGDEAFMRFRQTEVFQQQLDALNRIEGNQNARPPVTRVEGRQE